MNTIKEVNPSSPFMQCQALKTAHEAKQGNDPSLTLGK